MRFAIEVAESVRANWPAPKPLFVRLSIEDEAGWGPAENARLVRILKTKGRRRHRLQHRRPQQQGPQLLPPQRVRLSGPVCGLHPPRGRHHDHGGRPHHSRRSGPKRSFRTRKPTSSLSAESSSTTRTGRWTRHRSSASIRPSARSRRKWATGSKSGLRRGFGGNPSTWQKGIAVG